MLVLAVAASCCDQEPAILLKQFDNVPNLHGKRLAYSNRIYKYWDAFAVENEKDKSQLALGPGKPVKLVMLYDKERWDQENGGNDYRRHRNCSEQEKETNRQRLISQQLSFYHFPEQAFHDCATRRSYVCDEKPCDFFDCAFVDGFDV
jgi:hypothetical protein